MKRITIAILLFALLLSLCACGGKPEETSIPTEQENKYTYEQREEISGYIDSAMAVYGYKYDVYAMERNEKIEISIYLKRTATGAREPFADTVEWAIPVVKESIEKYSYDLGKLYISFLLYDKSLDEDADKVYSYDTSNLDTGHLFCSAYGFNDVVNKLNINYKDVRGALTE